MPLVVPQHGGAPRIHPTPLLLQALLADLGHSAMFLGPIEAVLLGDHMGVQTFIHGGGEDRLGPLGLRAINRWDFARVGSGEASVDSAHRPLLLFSGGHYTVVRPTLGSEPGDFEMAGSRYVEVTQESPEGGASKPQPVIAKDGHCLIASLHYLRTGVALSPHQLWDYRRHLAVTLNDQPNLLREIAISVVEETLTVPQPYVEGLERYAKVGREVSAILRQDPSFGAAYRKALAAQEARLEGPAEGGPAATSASSSSSTR